MKSIKICLSRYFLRTLRAKKRGKLRRTGSIEFLRNSLIDFCFRVQLFKNK